MEIKFHGHSCFELSEGETEAPGRPVPQAEQPGGGGDRRGGRPDPHRDHATATPTTWPTRSPVAKRTGAALRRDRRDRRTGSRSRAWRRSSDPNLGGTVELRLGLDQARARLAHEHAPRLRRVAFQRRARAPPIGTAAGLLINIGGVTVYHAGDTCLFSDMKLIAERNPVDVAMLPIGGHYTMDRHDARGRGRVRRRRHGDPDALRHLPADRDRLGRLQGRRRGDRPPPRWSCSPRARRTRTG